MVHKDIDTVYCTFNNGKWIVDPRHSNVMSNNKPGTVDYLLFDCSKLDNEREKLIAYISREDNWPVRKSELVNKYLKQVIHFTKSIDYEKL